MKSLPRFQARPFDVVKSFAHKVFLNARQPDTSQLHKLIAYDDGHYRAIFEKAYFGESEPSKSQWNTLKKRLKRTDKQLFIFKDYGSTTDDKYYYLDFGFFAD